MIAKVTLNATLHVLIYLLLLLFLNTLGVKLL